jgi:hypothetical protein
MGFNSAFKGLKYPTQFSLLKINGWTRLVKNGGPEHSCPQQIVI